MAEPADFAAMDETAQARFLLDLAERALPALHAHPDIEARITAYVAAARAVLDGDVARHGAVLRFLDDPDMADDFASYFAQLDGDERACAALDLTSFACGFVARITAPAAGVTALPDPVLESLPEVWDHYYRARAAFLGL